MKKVKVSVSPVLFKLSETGGKSDRKKSGRPKATTESEDKFLRVSSLVIGAHRTTASSTA